MGVPQPALWTQAKAPGFSLPGFLICETGMIAVPGKMGGAHARKGLLQAWHEVLAWQKNVRANPQVMWQVPTAARSVLLVATYSSNPHHCSVSWALLLCPFLRGGNQRTERSSDLSKATQLGFKPRQLGTISMLLTTIPGRPLHACTDTHTHAPHTSWHLPTFSLCTPPATPARVPLPAIQVRADSMRSRTSRPTAVSHPPQPAGDTPSIVSTWGLPPPGHTDHTRVYPLPDVSE